MLGKLSDLGPDDRFDCCVIGTGPAGMSCALALAARGKRVALMEGGAREQSEWSQDLYRGRVVGDRYSDLSVSRLRFFGGTSNHWAGWCRTLDEADFEAKGSFTETRWPIGKADLDPYLAEASRILEVPAIPPDRPLGDSGINQVFFVFSPPVRFADKYAGRLEADARIFLALEASLSGLETDGASITAARFADGGGAEHRVRAASYVLATGGIENSRLLLWSNEQTGGQVVKQASALGRYWMEHLHMELGAAIFSGRSAYALDRLRHAYFAPTPAAMREDDILNCGLRLQVIDYEGTRGLVADVACVAPDLSRWMLRQLGRNLICGAVLAAAWEQEPRAENRIELDSERDALGMPRARLVWRKSDTDLRTVRETALRFGAHFARSDGGRVRVDPWVMGEAAWPDVGEIGGFHHMGGTRMAMSQARGVVDRDCKVFGQSNLFVAGSSVFPSGGHANPTLTIVQLALRLADHIGARF
jgi:choline dehydrogenase-like flavoprotein